MKDIIIAIDGFSSCGKSTLAKQLAKKLNYMYIDSGAMYRAITLFALNNKYVSENNLNKQELVSMLNHVNLRFEFDDNNSHITILNNSNVENEIRDIRVSSFVSLISKIPEVRKKMVALQREMGKNKRVVMDGRDIGTVVFPNAELKLFITADIEVRAKRRYAELKEKNLSASLEEIKNNIAERDRIDQSRSESPLRKAKDAILIDNSNISKEKQLLIAIECYKNAINA